MTQNPDSQISKCPTCGAEGGDLCITRSGDIAEKVHYGRPYWSKQVRPRFAPLTPEEKREKWNRLIEGAP